MARRRPRVRWRRQASWRRLAYRQRRARRPPAPPIVPQATTSPTPVVQGAMTPVAIGLAQATLLSIQGSMQPVIITVGPETPTMASPALVPLLAPEISAFGARFPRAASGPPPHGHARGR